MPPSSSQTPECSRLSGGVDTLHACVYGEWPEAAWEKITPRLEAAKESAARSNKSDGEFLLAPAGDDMLVLPYGVRHGVLCRWAFKWRGCQFDLVRRRRSEGCQPIIFVSIPSRVLLATDWWSAWLEVRELLDLLGFVYSSSIASRVDVCADFPGQSVQPFVDAYRQGRIITRARKRGGYGDSPTNDTGLQLGRGALVLRIYDKALECQRDEEKRELMIAGRWGGEECETAARVEFQVRRAVIKQHGVYSVEQLRGILPLIVGYCCEVWCRMTGPVDRVNHNQSRAELDPLWQSVCDAFRAWSFYIEPGRRQRRTVQLEARTLVRQALGCLSSALAVSRKPITSADEAMKAICEAFELDLGELVERTSDKRRRWNVNAGARLDPPTDIAL